MPPTSREIEFRRWFGSVEEMPRGFYRAARRSDGGAGATIRCPDCGDTFSLHAGHRVSANGVVIPSIVCPHKPCPFHPTRAVLVGHGGE